jgi:hypothetical protein
MSPSSPPNLPEIRKIFATFTQAVAQTAYQLRHEGFKNNWLRLASLCLLLGAGWVGLESTTWYQLTYEAPPSWSEYS